MSEQEKRLAISVKNRCTEKEMVDNLAIYKLPLKCASKYSGASSIVRRFSYGEPNLHLEIKTKTILVMGATGSGKTTWINAMINYVLGVEFEDDFRFKLVDEQVVGESQAHSQTQGVTAYDIFYLNGFRIPFTLTIVDTPGFGDTQGITRDKEITTAVQQCFEHENGIKILDAVGFVVQSSLARLTASQTYIFNSVLEIFGKDIEKNILFLTTFADGDTPQVLAAIKEAKLPCKKDTKGSPCYKSFRNAAIFKSPQSANKRRLLMDWEDGMENFDSFFEELTHMKPQSLQMTQQVLHNRKQLELKLEWIQKAIPKHLMKMEVLRNNQRLKEKEMADDSEHMMKRGKKAFNAAKEKMSAILNEVNIVRQSLKYLKRDAENFYENCNAARTVGKTTSAVGAGLTLVGCAGAFFTGGASLFVTSALVTATLTGAASTAVGQGVNVATNMIDRMETAKYIKTITSKVSGLQSSFNELEDELTEVQKTIEWMMKSYGLDENEALYLYNKVIKIGDPGVAAFKAARDLSQITNTEKSVGTITKTATEVMSFSITTSSLPAEWQVIDKFTPIGKETVSVIAGKVIEGTFALVGVGVAVWDIVSLVKDWNSSTHPAVKSIDDVFDKLNLLERNIREKLSIMKNIE